MTSDTRNGIDNLSNLGHELKKIEETYIGAISADLANARNSTLGILHEFSASRMNLGRVLRVYKAHFKAEQGWTAAAKAIATAIDRDERTIYRILEGYERASNLPSIVLEVMEDRRIDPAAAKNAGMVENLLSMPEPETREEAAQAISILQHEVSRKKLRQKKTSLADLSQSEFVAHIVKQFTERYSSSPSQKRSSEIRQVWISVADELRVEIRKPHMHIQSDSPARSTIHDVA